MSLEAQQPVFDIPFEDLYGQLRDRIPRYAPAWTNFNDTDPGITLLQLFAWLAEMTLHKMNDVPRHTYLKFAELLGLELSAARAASVALVFTPKAADIPDTIPARARYAGRGTDGTVTFETIQALDVIGAQLAGTFIFADGSVTQRDLPTQPQATPFWPLGRAPVADDALYLAFKPNPNNPTPFPQKMRFLALLPAEDTNGQTQQVGTQDSTLDPPVELAWEYRAATGAEWVRLSQFGDSSTSFMRDGYIDVEGPQDITPSVEPAVGTALPGSFYWLRIRLDQGTYPTGKAPRLEHLLPNAVEAVNLLTETDLTLGISSGQGGQTFVFPKLPVDPGSLQLQLESSDGTVDADWELVDDLLDSGPDDKHYELNATSGTVTFGDGTNGLIPQAAAEIVAKQWRYGGGSAGNGVTAGTVKTIITQIAGIDKVMNPRAAAGGGEEQTLDDFITKAPRQLRSGGRAVTAADFETLATSIQGVKKALALGGRHPDFPDVSVPGAITVFVVADTDDSPPIPSAELIRAVCGVIDGVRLITTEVYVAAPTFVEVRVEARLLAPPEAAFDQVASDAQDRLDSYLSPLQRDFGEDISPAALYSALFGPVTEERMVRSVQNLVIYVDGLAHDISQPISVGPDALVYPGRHLIIVRPDPDMRVSR
jgi:predicted phage baseplate assembly protein